MTTFTDADDRRLHGHFASLAPPESTVARLQVRVLEGYDARPRSLWREWLNLLAGRPVGNTAWVAAAAAALFFTTPLGALPRLLALSNQPTTLTQRGSDRRREVQTARATVEGQATRTGSGPRARGWAPARRQRR